MESGPSSAKNGITNISDSTKENGLFLGNDENTVLTVDQVQAKIAEFSKEFNSAYRLILLNCKQEEKPNLIYSLLSLKKNIKYALDEVGHSRINKIYQFRCGLCDDNITVNAGEDVWSSLQQHEHFEELYCQFLKGDLDLQSATEDPKDDIVQTTSESESSPMMEDVINAGDSNTDSGIEQQDVEATVPLVHVNSALSNKTVSSDDVNSFRFNFNSSCDKEIEEKIFPSSMMQAVRRYDKVRDCSMMRIGGGRAACLICNCEMNNMRIGKHTLMNHAMGQRHLKAASDLEILESLQAFHDFWLKQETIVQAHEVYFRPYTLNRMKCTLCAATFAKSSVFPHILSPQHKRIVMEIYDRRINIYYLINLQIQVYGVTPQEIEAREAEFKKLEEAKAKEVRRAKNSESDATDDQRRGGGRSNVSLNHNIIKAVEKTESVDQIEQLPNRMKEYAAQLCKVPNSFGTNILCKLCKLELKDNVEILKKHFVSSPAHRKPNFSYYCEICDLNIRSEGLWMKHDFTANRHEKMAPSRKTKVAEYECTTCKLVIFGDDISLTRHLAIGNTRAKRERGNKLTEPIKTLLQSKVHLLSNASLLAGNAELVLKNRLTQDCCNKLESVLREVFSECRVYPFGSRVSGIGSLQSDLDVFVDVGGTYFGQKFQDPAEQVTLLREAFKILNKDKDYSQIVKVSTARTPILKLHHIPTRLACDLSFKHGLSVENTKFIRLCIELQPIVQELILLVKKWAEFITYENISTYAFAMMCIFFLQVNGYLPSVQKIRSLNGDVHPTISGWKIINYTLSPDDLKTCIKTYAGTVYELLQEFFKYYSKFDFNSYVVCPLLGQLLKRSLFASNNPADLPPEMSAYVAQLEGDDPEIFRFNSYMCVQDPFDLSHNLTKAVQQGTLTKFQTLCKLSLAHMEASSK